MNQRNTTISAYKFLSDFTAKSFCGFKILGVGHLSISVSIVLDLRATILKKDGLI